MNDLIEIGKREIGKELINTVNARELHEYLESKRKFSNWIQDRIKKYDFQQDTDFIIILLESIIKEYLFNSKE